MTTLKSAENGMVKSDVKLDGKTVLITGANSGLGLETSIDLSRRGARLIMACRNMVKAANARERVLKEAGCDPKNVVCKQLDMASFASIRKFASDINSTEARLDILVNNAGVMACPLGRTEDGFEMQFGVNHLGHFLLTNLLLDLLKKSAPSRIVIVSSLAHTRIPVYWEDINWEKSYDEMKAYQSSKAMNVLFARHLSNILKGTGVTANSLHPGIVQTELARHANNEEGKRLKDYIEKFIQYAVTPREGAQTQIYVAIAPELEGVSGKYFAKCAMAEEADHVKSDDDAKRLWDLSLKYAKL